MTTSDIIQYISNKREESSLSDREFFQSIVEEYNSNCIVDVPARNVSEYASWLVSKMVLHMLKCDDSYNNYCNMQDFYSGFEPTRLHDIKMMILAHSNFFGQLLAAQEFMNVPVQHQVHAIGFYLQNHLFIEQHHDRLQLGPDEISPLTLSEGYLLLIERFKKDATDHLITSHMLDQ